MKMKNSHPLLFGTFVLTLTGLVSRIIGFFYRIYLSRLFGEEGMGIYQLLSPVLSLSFALTAAGYQTAVSKLVAEGSAREGRPSAKPLAAAFSISLPLSLICSFLICRFSDFIAVSLLGEPRTASMLRILSFSVPLSAVHACVNGYFYGRKKTGIPAASQLLEQLVRVACVWLGSMKSLSAGETPSIDVAVLGLTVGELFSMLLSLIAIWQYLPRHTAARSSERVAGSSVVCFCGAIPRSAGSAFSGWKQLYGSLFAMALPLTANRIVLNLLQSIESVSIPEKLRVYGYDNVTALSVYGVLTGMAMPLIFFPNALTSSLSILLLPTISENYSLGNLSAVKSSAVRTVKYCGLLGILCMAGFVLFGNFAGVFLFDSQLAGYFITTLGFLCPFLYLDTTLSGILQGLGKAGHLFVMNVLCLLVRLCFVFLAIPRFGIRGYLWGLLVSQLILCLLYLGCLHRFFRKLPHTGCTAAKKKPHIL